MGSLELDVPLDSKSTFEPQIVKKRQKDISEIDQYLPLQDRGGSISVGRHNMIYLIHNRRYQLIIK